jgi:hypothetical protein
MLPSGIDSLDYWLGLIMEYAIGNITVAISWSDYFTSLMENIINALNHTYIGICKYLLIGKWIIWLPMVLKMLPLMQGGKSFENLNTGLQTAYNAWTTSPTIGSFHIVADLPALFIIVLITAWCIVERIKARNIMVLVKLFIILLVIAVGVFY